MAPGTYTLLVALDRPTTVTFGALGDRDLDAGGYAYVGSAFGPGGLSRVDRHRRVASGEHDVHHWHIDYLLGHPAARLVDVEITEGDDIECAVATALADTEGCTLVPSVGASDCCCDAHLAYNPDLDTLREAVAAAHGKCTCSG